MPLWKASPQTASNSVHALLNSLCATHPHCLLTELALCFLSYTLLTLALEGCLLQSSKAVKDSALGTRVQAVARTCVHEV